MIAPALLALTLTATGIAVQVADTVEGVRARVVQWDGSRARAQALLAQLEGAPPLLGLPAGLPTGVTVVLADSEERFADLAGGAIPDWTAGLALLDQNTILIPDYAHNRSRGGNRALTLRHEWAHLGLEQYLEGLRIPRWFHEGYARQAAGEWDAGSAWTLRWALATGAAPPLDSLSLNWPVEAGRAGLAYDLSATAVEYLLRPKGEEGIRIFLERWKMGGSFEDALRGVFGFTSGQFEAAWVRYLKRHYGWFLVLSQSVVLWLALGSLLLVLWRWRARRVRRRMARLRATEPPDQPAYWNLPEEAPAGPGEAQPNPGEEPG